MRLEERRLFPLIERSAGEERLGSLGLRRPDGVTAPVVAEPGSSDGRGVVWSATSRDLNVNLVAWPAGAGVAEHVNAERDVLWLVTDGGAEVTVDGGARAVVAGDAVLIPAGARRGVRAGEAGVRYVSAHVRRGPAIPVG